MSPGRIGNELRSRIAVHFQHRCAYCRSPLSLFPGSQQLDHIFPTASGGTDDEENLCFCCPWCNTRKGDRISATDPVTRRKLKLFHPRQQPWPKHFAWSIDFLRIDGLTASGRATVDLLDMNNVELLHARSIWISAGWHPPREN
jgi:HNH endonuclease